MTQTYFYNWPTEADAAADGAMTLDAETQTYQPASGWTRTPGPVWLQSPVMSDPNPETGEQEVLEAGVQSEPVVLLRKGPIVDLSDHLITPEGHGGFA